MKRTSKPFMIFLMTSYAIAMALTLAIGIRVYQGLKIEQKLDDEFAEIEYLINNEGLDNNNIDIKLNSYISSGEYLDVERAIKNYLKDLLVECRNLEDIYTNTQLNNVLYLNTFDADAPYFNNSKNIIDTAKKDLEEIHDNLIYLFDEATIMSYINNYNLNWYYEEYFKTMMIDQDLIAENKEDISDSIDSSILMLNAYTDYFTFLSDNAESWTMDEDYIYFDTDEQIAEYNRLLDIIMNMDFFNNSSSFI